MRFGWIFSVVNSFFGEMKSNLSKIRKKEMSEKEIFLVLKYLLISGFDVNENSFRGFFSEGNHNIFFLKDTCLSDYCDFGGFLDTIAEIFGVDLDDVREDSRIFHMRGMISILENKGVTCFYTRCHPACKSVLSNGFIKKVKTEIPRDILKISHAYVCDDLIIA